MDRRKLTSLAVLAVAVVVGVALVRRSLGIELDLDPDTVRTAVSGLGVWAPLVYVGVVAFRVPLGLPSQVILVGGGLLFGTLAGTLYGALGITLSALVLFVASRWAGQEAVEERIPERLRSVHELAGTRVGAVFMAVGTGYPLGPITMYHLIAGITGMALPIFAVSVFVGALVRSATFTYFGSSLMARDPRTLVQAAAVVALALLVPLAVPRTRAWLLHALGRAPAAQPDA